MAPPGSTIEMLVDEPARQPVEFGKVTKMRHVPVPKRSGMVHTLGKSALDNCILDNRAILN
jgi:hypothetical protein